MIAFAIRKGDDMSIRNPLLILAGLITTLALIACGGEDGNGNGSTNGNGDGVATGDPQQPAATATPSTGGGAGSGGDQGGTGSGDGLAGLSSAFTEVTSFRADIQIEGAGAPAQQGFVEYVAPDRTHLQFDAGPVGAFEAIIIGTTAYLNFGGTWTQLPDAAAVDQSSFDLDSVRQTIEGLDASGYTAAGTDNVNGQECQIYTLTTSGGGQELCVAGNLPVRMTTTGGGLTTTVTFSQFNANISIEAPI
jgi:hypothetical protein